MKAIFSNTHLKRVNIFVLESMIPRLGSLAFLPFLFRYVSTPIWAEIGLMIAISEILIKLYLFGFQSSIYRFANELSESQKNLVLNKLIKRILLISFNVAIFFEVSQKFYWDFIFEFEFGLPMRTAILISTVSALNIFLIQYIKSLRQSRKLFIGSTMYTLICVFFQFSSISYLSNNYGMDDRMMVTAYLVSIAIASIVRSFYYINFLTIKFSMTGASKKNNITDFLTYAKPAAGIGFIAILVTHGIKLIIQNNISLEILGKYFSYLSYAGIYFVIFSATQAYLTPKLYTVLYKNSENYRILLMYFWTISGFSYIIIFNKFSAILIPNNYRLDKKTFLLIFLIQIFSMSRTLSGIYFDIEKKLNLKLLFFGISSLLFLIFAFMTNNLEEFLIANLVFYFLVGNLYLLYSREIKLLINFNFLKISILLISFNYADSFFYYENYLLFVFVLSISFLLPKIIESYESLPNVNSGNGPWLSSE